MTGPTNRSEADVHTSHGTRATAALAMGLLCLALAACGGGKHAAAQTSASQHAETHNSGVSAAQPAPSQQKVVVDGLPRVKLRRGELLLSDGDADNPKDTDGEGDVDPGKDLDNDSHTLASYDAPDADDTFDLDLGKGASPAETRALSALVTRYFSAARAEDAATTCSMLLPAEAASLSAGRSRKPGETCESAAAFLLKELHHELADAIKVVDVRIVGEAAEVVLGSQVMPASYVLLKRDAGAWKLDGLLMTHLL